MELRRIWKHLSHRSLRGLLTAVKWLGRPRKMTPPHSRWEAFLKRTDNKPTDAECSFFLRSMELEDSDDDDQVADSNMLTLVEAGVLGDEQVMNLDRPSEG